jgi:hypothetical protein
MAGQSAMLTRKEAARMQKTAEVSSSKSTNSFGHGTGGDPACHDQKGTIAIPGGHDHHPYGGKKK